MNMGLTTSNADRSHTSDVKTEEGAWYGKQYHNQQRVNTICSPVQPELVLSYNLYSFVFFGESEVK